MNKTAILTLAVAIPAMAGTPGPIATVPVPEPVVAPAAPTCALEVAGVYRAASRDLYSVGKSIDTYGADLTAVHSLTPNHALTLRVGYAYGSEVLRPAVPGDTDVPEDSSFRTQIESLCFMPGYRFTMPVSDNLSVFAGVNAGVAWTELTARYRDGVGQAKHTDQDWSFVASAELGASYKVCEHVSVFAAYEISGNTAKFSVFGDEHHATHQQVYHGVRAGVSISF